MLSLDELESDNLAQLLLDSLRQVHKLDLEHCIARAIDICSKSLESLRTQHNSSSLKKTKEAVTSSTSLIPRLSRDLLFEICEYVDQTDILHLRLSSMEVHVLMMGCPLSLSDGLFPVDFIGSARSLVGMKKVKSNVSTPFPRCPCTCLSSRAFELVSVGSLLKINPPERSTGSNKGTLSISECNQLGIYRPWTVTSLLLNDVEPETLLAYLDVFVGESTSSMTVKTIRLRSPALARLCCHPVFQYIEELVCEGDDNFYGSISLTSFSPCCLLTNIRKLQLDNYRAKVDISAFTALTNLCHLGIRDTHFTEQGSSMKCLSLLTKLQHLEILQSTFPDEVSSDDFLSPLSKLEILSIHESIIVGLDSVTMLTNLRHLSIDTNSGNVSSLLSKLVHLKHLELRNSADLRHDSNHTQHINTVHGDFSLLCQLKGLTYVSICLHDIDTNLEDLSLLHRLKFLHLRNVSGSLQALAPMKHLEDLSLGVIFEQNESLYGKLEHLSHMTNLVQLKLVSCCVDGNLESISMLTKLKRLQILDATICGDISSLSQLTSLTFLHLDSPQVAGHISSLAHCFSLYSFKLSLTGVRGLESFDSASDDDDMDMMMNAHTHHGMGYFGF